MALDRLRVRTNNLLYCLLSDGVNSKLVRLLSYWFSYHDGKTNTELNTEHISVLVAIFVYNFTLSFNLLNV